MERFLALKLNVWPVRCFEFELDDKDQGQIIHKETIWFKTQTKCSFRGLEKVSSSRLITQNIFNSQWTKLVQHILFLSKEIG